MKKLAAALLACYFSAAYAQDFSERELRVLQSFNVKNIGEAPAQPSNTFANNNAAAQLGEQLFFDPRFSANGELSCASCHQPERHFTDGKPRAVGVNRTGRNTMTVVGSAHQRWFYWDGRRDSLWSQALIPFEAADEMGSSRVDVIRKVSKDSNYSQQYMALFGPFPSDLKLDQLPQNAGPYGDDKTRDNWERLGQDEQSKLNRIYSNLGKAIEAYERTLEYQPTRFDRYLDALAEGKQNSDILTPQEVAGAKLFIDAKKTQCLQCHNGPTFSNGDFHNIGTGNFSGANLDFGRVFGVQAVLMDEFNCLGPYSDAEERQCDELRFLPRDPHLPLEGAFKTPSLRNLTETAPYFHDGSKKTLREVMEHYNTPPDPKRQGAHELNTLDLSDEEIEQLLSFLNTLSD